jgi:hypothetical protein
VQKVDPLGAVSGLTTTTPATTVGSTASSPPNPASVPPAPPDLLLPTVRVADSVRAADVVEPRAAAGTIPAAPVPEPNAPVVLGLSALAYYLRRRLGATRAQGHAHPA